MINLNFVDHIFEIPKLNNLTSTMEGVSGLKKDIKPNSSS